MVLWTSVSCLALVPRMYLSLCRETHVTLSTSFSCPGKCRICWNSCCETHVAGPTSVSCSWFCRICLVSCCETHVTLSTSVSCPGKCRVCRNPCCETDVTGPTSVCVQGFTEFGCFSVAKRTSHFPLPFRVRVLTESVCFPSVKPMWHV